MLPILTLSRTMRNGSIYTSQSQLWHEYLLYPITCTVFHSSSRSPSWKVCFCPRGRQPSMPLFLNVHCLPEEICKYKWINKRQNIITIIIRACHAGLVVEVAIAFLGAIAFVHKTFQYQWINIHLNTITTIIRTCPDGLVVQVSIAFVQKHFNIYGLI